MTSRHQCLGASIQNGGLIQPIFPVKIRNIPGLAEAVHAKRHDLLPPDGPKPPMGGGVAIQHRHHGGARGQRRQQGFNPAWCPKPCPRLAPCGQPITMQFIGAGNGQ